jgi:hypothetical protein
MTNLTKRVNIILKHITNEKGETVQEGNIILRVGSMLAAREVREGRAYYTNKQRLKSILKRGERQQKNVESLKRKGIKIENFKAYNADGSKVGRIVFDPTNGKTQVKIAGVVGSGIVAGLDYRYVEQVFNLEFGTRQMPVSYD